MPYRAFEADNRQAVEAAIGEIDNLEARPILYEERVPRRDLSHFAYAGAALAILLLVLAKLGERELLASARMLPPMWIGRFYRADTGNFPAEDQTDEVAVAAMADHVTTGLEGIKRYVEGEGAK